MVATRVDLEVGATIRVTVGEAVEQKEDGVVGSRLGLLVEAAEGLRFQKMGRSTMQR